VSALKRFPDDRAAAVSFFLRFSPSNDDEASEKAGALARQSRASQSKPFAPFDAALSPFSWQSATVRGCESFLSNGRRERCFRIREKKPRREAPNMTRSTEETHPVLFLATRARLVAVSLALFQKKLNMLMVVLVSYKMFIS